MNRTLPLMVAMTLALSACTEEVIMPSQPDARTPISFTTYLPRTTRGEATLATISTLRESGFQLVGFYDDSPDLESLVVNALYRVDESSTECYPATADTPPAYWPSDKETPVTFLAVYPASAMSDGSFGYNPDNDIIICTADGSTDYIAAYVRTSESETLGGTVNLTFKHLLGQVVLQVKGDKDLYNYRLTSATITTRSSTSNYDVANDLIYPAASIQQPDVIVPAGVDYPLLSADEESRGISTTATRIGSLMLPVANGTGTTCQLTLTFTGEYNGSVKNYTRTADVTLVAGYQNNITAIIAGDTPLSVSVAATEDWIDYHEYVDLGLPSSGLLWATCNVGAEKPEEYGDYYAWGETKAYGQEDLSNLTNFSYAGTYTKTYFGWGTYKYCNGSESDLTKYNDNAGYGSVDDKTSLDLVDDAAHVNWGGGWRIPTIEEWQQLVDNCETNWTTKNGVNGYEFVSKVNGKSIFLPAAGYVYGTGPVGNGYGLYLSSSLTTHDPTSSRGLDFNFSYVGTDNTYDRLYGKSVRAVREP